MPKQIYDFFEACGVNPKDIESFEIRWDTNLRAMEVSYRVSAGIDDNNIQIDATKVMT